MHPMVPMSIVTYSRQRMLARTPPRLQIGRAYEITGRVPHESDRENHRFAGG
jgi:hypothetical protein